MFDFFTVYRFSVSGCKTRFRLPVPNFCFLNRVSVSGSKFLFSNRVLVSGFQFRVSVSGFQFPVPVFGFGFKPFFFSRIGFLVGNQKSIDVEIECFLRVLFCIFVVGST